MSWQDIRRETERFAWTDQRTGARVTGFNPPKGAKDVRRVPFFIRYVTKDGRMEQGEVTCIKVFNQLAQGASRGIHQRLIRFEASGQIRRICDILVCEVNGFRVIAG